jgi:hypothetical protein
VPITTWANATATVDVPDDVTDPAIIAEMALEQFEGASLCRQCSSLDLGDEWNTVLDSKTGRPEVYKVTE